MLEKSNGSVQAMKSLLIVYSYHHNNTEKIANVIGRVLDAKVKAPAQIGYEDLLEYDLLGFGSGIDSDKHYKVLLDFADKLPKLTDKKAFIFSTSGVTWEEKRVKDHATLREKLVDKGCMIVGEFQCKGFNTNSFLRFFGGINKDRPNAEDLKNAEEFAQNLKRSGS